MNEKSPPQASEDQAQRQAERVRLAHAFGEVFGFPKSRSAVQTLVLAHLEKEVDEDSNAFNFKGTLTDGLAIALAASHRDGAQSRLRIINRQVRLSETEQVQKTKPKNTVKR